MKKHWFYKSGRGPQQKSSLDGPPLQSLSLHRRRAGAITSTHDDDDDDAPWNSNALFYNEFRLGIQNHEDFIGFEGPAGGPSCPAARAQQGSSLDGPPLQSLSLDRGQAGAILIDIDDDDGDDANDDDDDDDDDDDGND